MGASTSVELLEFPFCASVVLWISFAVFAFWTLHAFLNRRPGHDHVTQAWLLVALFAFPWLYAGGSILLSSHNLPGSGRRPSRSSTRGLCTAFIPCGSRPWRSGALYYLIPKISGISIRFAHQDAARLLGAGLSSRPGPPCTIWLADPFPRPDGHGRARDERADLHSRRADRP